MPKHTPQPWRFSASDGFQVTTSRPGILEGSKEICKISDFDKSIREIHANGHLISAAPDLLASLKEMVELFPNSTMEQQNAKAIAVQAINKATGKTLIDEVNSLRGGRN